MVTVRSGDGTAYRVTLSMLQRLLGADNENEEEEEDEGEPEGGHTLSDDENEGDLELHEFDEKLSEEMEASLSD